ncbi:MAG: PilZ domain-containing protein [Desulfuromonadaceae bacterium]|nr:PilZ domain-containing protein [Desulfuromonadaceae bacterium]MDD2849403.1 PilZ domain-containing protein [Desulfuromonadaceae bacterium]MDD4130029.1 PilZ domain-containing protein [Desulfuromonadaceae bacterium]
MPLPPQPILVVSYIDETRAALTAVLNRAGALAVPCASFCEAENLALEGLYSGILVDLPSIIKSKGEEKIVACTLANFFPTLRVRTMGGMLVPMTMPGSAKQDRNLDDFLSKTCSTFEPRKLRVFRRHPVCLSTLVNYNDSQLRGFTLNISWGGMFIVDFNAEKFSRGDRLTVVIPEFDWTIQAEVRRTMPWGIMRTPPGIGLSFISLDETVEAVIAGITRSCKEFDRDRVSA